jgi:hypothetical protein
MFAKEATQSVVRQRIIRALCDILNYIQGKYHHKTKDEYGGFSEPTTYMNNQLPEYK